ncbi:hypothetical protein QE152_g36667 [Popillia japonica]|uniref:Uncharacterized protein n=1 Tax=Popillia japonica TaxID=7064 RepID=A0AAW1ICL1_POPJA
MKSQWQGLFVDETRNTNFCKEIIPSSSEKSLETDGENQELERRIAKLNEQQLDKSLKESTTIDDQDEDEKIADENQEQMIQQNEQIEIWPDIKDMEKSLKKEFGAEETADSMLQF